MPGRTDHRLLASVAKKLLDELHVYRCSGCGLVLVQADPLYAVRSSHRRCGGTWHAEARPAARDAFVMFLTHEMLSTDGLIKRRSPRR